MKVELHYDIVERYGRRNVEVSVSNGVERVIVFHEEVNHGYIHGGAEGAAWGMVVERIAGLFKDTP